MVPRRGFLTGLGIGGTVVAAGMAAARVTSRPERQDIARLSPQRVALLNATIGEMQRRSRRDPSDPKGWRVNAVAHAHVCSSVSNADPAQVHGCWWFLPWHRAFLAVTEWKLRALSGDPTLALPYWNWSTDRRIPTPFAQAGSALADAVRYTPDRDLRPVEVDRLLFDPVAARRGVAGLAARSFAARTPAAIPNSFGGIAKPNAGGWHGRSRLETIPHNAVHNYVGGEGANGAFGDMTELATAAFDPIFFAHHGNLDRLWEIWRQDPAHRATEPTELDFIQKEFLFPWIDGTIVAVPMRDVLDMGRLGYTYDSLAVLRDGAASEDDALSSIVTSRRLASAILSVPADAAHCVLKIRGVEPGDRPTSVEIALARPGDVASWISVGAIAMGRTHSPATFPDTEPRFDVTAAVGILGARALEVAVLALPLSVGQRDSPQFRHSTMEIVAAA
ncbi:MAG TPA: tyrosinase family protein [Acetobacteraceae bacterium]|jgi:hypothetical protein